MLLSTAESHTDGIVATSAVQDTPSKSNARKHSELTSTTTSTTPVKYVKMEEAVRRRQRRLRNRSKSAVNLHGVLRECTNTPPRRVMSRSPDVQRRAKKSKKSSGSTLAGKNRTDTTLAKFALASSAERTSALVSPRRSHQQRHTEAVQVGSTSSSPAASVHIAASNDENALSATASPSQFVSSSTISSSLDSSSSSASVTGADSTAAKQSKRKKQGGSGTHSRRTRRAASRRHHTVDFAKLSSKQKQRLAAHAAAATSVVSDEAEHAHEGTPKRARKASRLAYQQSSEVQPRAGESETHSSAQSAVLPTVEVTPAARPVSVGKTLEEAREMAIDELISTEESYIAHLSTLIQQFQVPLNSLHLVSSEEVVNVFSPVLSEIYKLHTETLLPALVERRANNTCMALAVLDALPVLEPLYRGYLKNYANAGITLERLQKEQPEFAKWVRDVEQMRAATGSGLGLGDFLIMPVQRIMRYSLLLKAVLKNTLSDTDQWTELQSAIALLENSCDKLNQDVDKHALFLEKAMVLDKLGHLSETGATSSSSSTLSSSMPMRSIRLRRLLLKSTTKLGLTLECELKHKAKSHGKHCSVLIVQDRLFVLLLNKAGVFKEIVQEFPIEFTDVAIDDLYERVVAIYDQDDIVHLEMRTLLDQQKLVNEFNNWKNTEVGEDLANTKERFVLGDRDPETGFRMLCNKVEKKQMTKTYSAMRILNPVEKQIQDLLARGDENSMSLAHELKQRLRSTRTKLDTDKEELDRLREQFALDEERRQQRRDRREGGTPLTPTKKVAAFFHSVAQSPLRAVSRSRQRHLFM